MGRLSRDAGLGLLVAVGAVWGCSSSAEEDAGTTQQAAESTANLKATVQLTTTWQNGYCANVDVTNSGSASANTWVVVLELNSATVSNTWNANFAGGSSRKTITPVSWNAAVAPGATQSFGYCAGFSAGSTTYKPIVISPLGSSGGGSSGGSGGGSGGSGGGGAGGSGGSGGKAGAGGTSGASSGGTAGRSGSAGGGAGGLSGSAGGGAGGAGGSAGTSGGAGGKAGAGGTGGSGGSGGAAGAGGVGGYAPVSDYLRNPDHALPVMKALADFRAKSRDNVNGGFFTFVNLDGSVSSDRRKGFVTMTRDAWTFSKTFMITGDEAYLGHASHALDFLFAHGWDNTNGGWYFTADERGNLTPYNSGWDPNTWKWSFTQHYGLLGVGANCEATRDPTVCGWEQRGREYLDTKMWDFRTAQLGYYEQTNSNGSNPINKSFTSTVDALTTNAIQTALLWPGTYEPRMVDLANIVVERLAPAMDLATVKLGFPETYNANWSVVTSSTGGDIGHVLKSAWVLARVAMRHPDARYRAAARKFIYEVLNNGGWDEARGVPYTHYEWNTGQVTQQAECWQIEQAVTAGLSNWYLADNQADKDAFLRMADRSLRFFDENVIDHARGGTYKLNRVTGEPAGGKSNFFNVEYHSTELFYFVYLYGNLLLNRAPVALYYMVPRATSAQVIQLNPVAVDDASLTIKSATLDGAPFSRFDAARREVTLGAGEGGKLRVVFAPAP